MDFRYHAIFEPQEGGGFHVQFLDFQDTFTQGDTEEECLFNAAEVLTGMLAAKLDHDMDIPAPGLGVPGSHPIAPDTKVQEALLAYFARKGQLKSDMERIKNLSEEDIQCAALSDPDAQPTDEEFWIRSTRVEHPDEQIVTKDETMRFNELPAWEDCKEADDGSPAIALRALRRRDGLSREALAKASGLKMGRIADMESGKRPIPPEVATILARIFQTSPKVFA